MNLPPELEAKVIAQASTVRLVDRSLLNHQDLELGSTPKAPGVATKKKSKYRNKKTRVGDLVFDSKKEAKRWLELCALQRAGRISFLRRQISFLLIPVQEGESRCKFMADFVYIENGQRVVEDVKGFKTAAYIIKRKLMLWIHKIKIRET